MERDQSSARYPERGAVVLQLAGVWNRRRRRDPLDSVPTPVLRRHLGCRRRLHLPGEWLVRCGPGAHGYGGAVGWVGLRHLERHRGRLILWKLDKHFDYGRPRRLRAGVLPPGADPDSLRRGNHRGYVRRFFPDGSGWQDLLSPPRNEYLSSSNPVLLPLSIQRLVGFEQHHPFTG